MDSDDKKITELTQVTSLSDSDLFVVAIDVGTAPKTMAITKSNALSSLGGAWGVITGNITDQTDLKYLAHNTPDGVMRNGKIVVTVATNDLTVAIKTLAGNDPSASEPVYIKINGVVRSITAALSVTKNAGTNWFNSGGSEKATLLCQYFVYLGYNATDGVVIGFSFIPRGRYYSDFSTTSTDATYCAISTITHASSTDPYVNIGRFSATLSAGAGYTWSISGTGDVVNYPIFETDWLTWAPVQSGFSSVPTAVFARYQITKNCRFIYRCGGSGGATSNATTYTFTLPIMPASPTNNTWQSAGNVIDNGTPQTTPGRIAIIGGTLAASVFKDFSSGAFTASGEKRVGGMQVCDYEY